MSIKIVPPSGLAFTDVSDKFRLIRGVALPKRAQFRHLHEAAFGRYNAWIESGCDGDLWAQKDYRSIIVQLLDLAHLKLEWLSSNSINLIPQLLLTYIKDDNELLGDWAAWEFPSSSSAQPVENTAELQAFNSLLIEDIHGALVEIFPLCASAYFRFVDLLEAMQPLLDSGFHFAYDNRPIFRRLVNESLSLFELNPAQVSASLAIELLVCDWIERDGQRFYMPGWLQQLCNPPTEYKTKGKLLPKGESPHHALIAAMWGEGSVRTAIADVDSVPYPVLRSILASRERMMEDSSRRSRSSGDNGKHSSAEQEFLESIDYDELMSEFRIDARSFEVMSKA